MPLARHALHIDRELIHVAQWPTVKEMHLVASRHYAFEGRCFVVAAGTVLRKRDLPDLELFREIPGHADDLRMIALSPCPFRCPAVARGCGRLHRDEQRVTRPESRSYCG